MASATPCQRVRVRRLRSPEGKLTSAATVDACTSESRVGTCALGSSTEYLVKGGAQAISRESVGPPRGMRSRSRRAHTRRRGHRLRFTRIGFG
jgi:hypothetical protein